MQAGEAPFVWDKELVKQFSWESGTGEDEIAADNRDGRAKSQGEVTCNKLVPLLQLLMEEAVEDEGKRD